MSNEKGHYRRVEIDLAGPHVQALRLEDGEAGIGAILRYDRAFVGFSMMNRSQTNNGMVETSSLIDASVQEAITAQKLRQRLATDQGTRRTLSVAICTKDGAARVARLLNSLLPLRDEVPFEVLVVDNAPSDDSTQRAVLEREHVKYFMEPKVGLNFGRNRAVQEATGDVLCFLDDDVTVDAGWALGMSAAWQANPDAGAITGLVLPLELETEAQVLFELAGGFRRGFLPLRYGPTSFLDPVHPTGSGKFGAGANMSMDLALVRQLGGFDDALDTGRPLPGGGDIDIFYRVLRSGAMLNYEPQAAVFHEHRRDLSVLKHQYMTWGLGLMAFVVKCYRTDKEARPAHRRLIFWWFSWMLSRIKDRALGRGVIPLSMIFAELFGGVKGLFGEYGRSVQRSDLIREQTP